MQFTLLYSGYKAKAVTFSYDDGIIQDKETVSILNKYHLKGTFNLNSGQSGEEKIRDDLNCSHLVLKDDFHIYDGHEIASHTYSHPHLETLTFDQQKLQFLTDKIDLERLIGKKVLGAAYPYGTYNSDTLKALEESGFKYCRTTKSTYEFSLPSNFLLWHPTIHHRDPLLFPTLDRFFESNDQLALFYLWGHSYEFALDKNFELLDKFCDIVSQKKDIWSATNYEIYSYVSASQMVYYRRGFFYNPSRENIYLKVKDDKLVIPQGGSLAYEDK